MRRGSKNLIILGVCASVIAVASTAVSLVVYHDSGDIYLDRSRPGFLPDDDEIIQPTDNHKYKFSEDQRDISSEEIDEYLLELEETQKKLDAVPDPYSATSISDEVLNIPPSE